MTPVSERMRERLRRRLRLALWAGVILSVVAAAGTFAALRYERRQDAHLHASRIADTLQLGIVAPAESVQAVAAFLAAQDARGTSLSQFRAFAAPFLEGHPELAALEWIPKVPGSRRAGLEAVVREEQPGWEMREPTRAGPLVRALERDVHLPIVYAEPLNPKIHGLDIAFDEPRSCPVWRALDTGKVTLSDRYQLVEDPKNVFSVIAFSPLKDVNWRPHLDPELKSGVVVGLFRLGALFEHALRNIAAGSFAVEVWDPAAPPELRLLYRRGDPGGALHFDGDVRFVDRTYRVVVAPAVAPVGLLPWAVLVAGLCITALGRAYVRAEGRATSLEQRVARLGQYTIELEIAKGGMGTVYRARHALLRRATAIKVANTEDVTEFEREALVTCTLNHPNTVQLYDFGKGDDGTSYLAMEYIEGFHLEDLVGLTGPLPPARAVRILLQTAGSLAEAHDRGLVHRDVKPRNVMITERGGVTDFVKVLDFGLAGKKATGLEEGGTTGMFEGTPGYAAPELLRGDAADARSDVFSLGCVAYFLLSGRPAFPPGASVVETLSVVLARDPDPLPGACPPSLAQIVLSCLSKSPASRPGDMRLLAKKLRATLADCSPWTQQDADAWWRAHPPKVTGKAIDRPETFSISFENRETPHEDTSRVLRARVVVGAALQRRA